MKVGDLIQQVLDYPWSWIRESGNGFMTSNGQLVTVLDTHVEEITGFPIHVTALVEGEVLRTFGAPDNWRSTWRVVSSSDGEINEEG